MVQLASRLKARARALGLSDSEVARRLGFDPQRYSNYAVGRSEPDLGTLIRIAKVLETTPDALLGVAYSEDGAGEAARLRVQLRETAAGLGESELRVLNLVADALARERATGG